MQIRKAASEIHEPLCSLGPLGALAPGSVGLVFRKWLIKACIREEEAPLPPNLPPNQAGHSKGPAQEPKGKVVKTVAAEADWE